MERQQFAVIQVAIRGIGNTFAVLQLAIRWIAILAINGIGNTFAVIQLAIHGIGNDLLLYTIGYSIHGVQ